MVHRLHTVSHSTALMAQTKRKLPLKRWTIMEDERAQETGASSDVDDFHEERRLAYIIAKPTNGGAPPLLKDFAENFISIIYYEETDASGK